MKILLVSNMYPNDKHPAYGIFVKRFTDELDKIGILYSKSVMYQHDGKIAKLMGYIVFYVKTFFKVLFGKYNYIYVHQASHSSPPVIAAAKFKKIKIFTNVHGCDVVSENASQEKMQKYTRGILKHSDRVIVPSEYYKKLVSKKYSIEENKIHIYPSAGVDRDTFFKKPQEEKKVIRKRYNFKEGVPIFGMAGRISEGKGWDTFVEAVSLLNEEGINATYVIVGSGREDNRLDKLLNEKNLTEDVVRIGLLPQNQLSDFYNAIDYLIFPTRRESESLGLVALEAMACGTPVIASDFAAPKYYVANGVNGYKFTVGSSRELAAVMKSCCDSVDTDKYKKLSDEALKTAEGYYSDNIRKELEDIMRIA